MSTESGGEAILQLLKQKYRLHAAPEVESAARRTKVRTKESVPNNPNDRIANYLLRLREITDRSDPRLKERGLRAAKHWLHDKYVIKPEEIPESYWESQRRIMRERGQGGDLARVDFEEFKRQNAQAIIADQAVSLDKWVDYLSSGDAPYPDAIKYWALRSVLSMSDYDKATKQFPRRSRGTTKLFPDLDREALAYALSAVKNKYIPKKVGDEPEQTEVLAARVDPELEALLQKSDFAKLYAHAIEKVTPAEKQGLTNVKGEWVKYNQGGDYMSLAKSLQGHGTGWCTAGEAVAEAHLEGGDFYVYYSYDSNGQPTVPRIAIRMEGNSIAEVRGIAAEQNLDPHVTDIVEAKLKDFPDGELYKKKVADMRRLTQIDNAVQQGEQLSVSDLIFLYEVYDQIQGFGYTRDPRIAELRSKRDVELDMPYIFDCPQAPWLIAREPFQIRSNTKAYVGPLTPDIFNEIARYDIKHVYTSFPEGKVHRKSLEIGGKSNERLLYELQETGISFHDNTDDMLRNWKFKTTPKPRKVNAVILSAADLGFSEEASFLQILQRAQQLGLSLCPPDFGFYLRMQYRNQPRGEWLHVGMVPIKSPKKGSFVVELDNESGKLNVDASWEPAWEKWDIQTKLIFLLPESKKKQDYTLLGQLKHLFRPER